MRSVASWLANRSQHPVFAAIVLALAILSAWFFGPLHERSWHEDAIGRIPPGREVLVEPWLDALKGEGVTVSSAQIQRESIQLRCVLDSGEGVARTGTVSLVRPGTLNARRLSGSFGLQVDGSGFSSAELERVVSALNTVLAKMDDGSFFHAKSWDRFQIQERRDGLWFEGGVRFSLEVMTWIIFFTLFVLLARSLARASLERKEWLILFALTALAGFLRITIPEAGPIHANGHGLHELSSFSSATLGPGDGWTDGSYGVGGAILFRFVGLLTGASGTELLRWMAVLLSLFTPVVALTVRSVGGDKYAGRLAAFLYAVTPILVRASPTETPLLWAALWAVCAAYFARSILIDSALDWLQLLFAVAAMTLAVQSHVVTVAWLVPWTLGCSLFFFRARLKVGLLVGAVWLLSAPHVAHVIQSYGVGNERGMNPAGRVVEQFGQPGIAAFNMFLTPFAVTIMALIALFSLRGRLRLTVWSAVIVTVPLFVSVTQTLSDVIRYQAPLTLATILLGALGLTELVRRASDPKARRVTRYILSFLMLISLIPSVGLYSVPDPETHVAAIVEDASSRGLLDEGLTVPKVVSNGRDSGFGAPSWALPAGAPRGTSEQAPVLLGSRCLTWSKEGERPSGTLHPTCARFVGTSPVPLLVRKPIPNSYGGLSLWFYPKRSGSAQLGIYQARPVSPSR